MEAMNVVAILVRDTNYKYTTLLYFLNAVTPRFVTSVLTTFMLSMLTMLSTPFYASSAILFARINIYKMK